MVGSRYFQHREASQMGGVCSASWIRPFLSNQVLSGRSIPYISLEMGTPV